MLLHQVAEASIGNIIVKCQMKKISIPVTWLVNFLQGAFLRQSYIGLSTANSYYFLCAQGITKNI